MDKTKQPPIEKKPDPPQQPPAREERKPDFLRGTADPTTKK